MGKPGFAISGVTSAARSRGKTRGSETSQYPPERKETSIPVVVANEPGRAQTDERVKRDERCARGVAGPHVPITKRKRV